MRRALTVALIPAAAMLVLAAFDILREPAPVEPAEIALDLAEKLLLVAAMGAVAWAAIGLRDIREEQRALKDHVDRTLARGEEWRAARSSEIAAFGEAIAREFDAWNFSPAERDVAGLLLKGVSMKEIALARNTSEATIRQQAQSLYHKAGLSGRAELSAYFLDSLFSDAGERQVKMRLV